MLGDAGSSGMGLGASYLMLCLFVLSIFVNILLLLLLCVIVTRWLFIIRWFKCLFVTYCHSSFFLLI